ncbi:PLAT repeat-containing protein [Thiorhodococcus drewsii AZ1]|uniref:PLAT repeat-containing protein n=2 Tax=Thiorhodococcus drewsii TaxID=210408 RepID=G2E864_9GAMM|nr:PLAT repeat-containing protein [Thiorhodococcus drewsii AZ1]
MRLSPQQEINPSPFPLNVSQVQVPNGKYVKTGANVWSEYDASGKPTYKFRETNRDAWSVYLNDPSRNVQLQLDLHRKWVSYGEDGGPKRDLYRITSAKG